MSLIKSSIAFYVYDKKPRRLIWQLAYLQLFWIYKNLCHQ
jgi:hypothetical protein